MNFLWDVLTIAGVLFACMLVAVEVGRRLGLRRLAANPDGLPEGVGAAQGAVFALLGLMVAFTFSGAASRFENRRLLITTEANAIGTAWLRIDLLPADAHADLHDAFRRYLDARLATYAAATNGGVMKARNAEAMALQGEIWSKALAAARRPEAVPQATQLLLPALNDMIDITTTRAVAAQNHPPLAVFLLLGAMCIIGALLYGYEASTNRSRSILHTVTFAAIMALAVYVILDLEYPRLGLIRIDSADQVLIDLRKSME
jgi:hypothetical protein